MEDPILWFTPGGEHVLSIIAILSSALYSMKKLGIRKGGYQTLAIASLHELLFFIGAFIFFGFLDFWIVVYGVFTGIGFFQSDFKNWKIILFLIGPFLAWWLIGFPISQGFQSPYSGSLTINGLEIAIWVWFSCLNAVVAKLTNRLTKFDQINSLIHPIDISADVGTDVFGPVALQVPLLLQKLQVASKG